MIVKCAVHLLEHTECTIAALLFRLPYFETSAANGQNVSKAVDCLLDRVMQRMERCVDKTSLPAKNGTTLEDGEAPNKSGCAC